MRCAVSVEPLVSSVQHFKWLLLIDGREVGPGAAGE